MKQTIKILLAVLFTNISVLYSQNIMQIHNTSGYTNDTIELTVEIINDIPFISFQFDVVLPEALDYIPNSALLTDRSLDHVMNVTEISGHRLRILSYSLNNSAFTGNSGPVVRFSLQTGNQDGSYEMKLQQVIIGDSLSQNIVDSTINGTVTIYLAGIESINKPERYILMYPNPCEDILNIKFQLDDKAEVLLESFDLISMKKNHILLGVFPPGFNKTQINLNNKNYEKTKSDICIYRLLIKENNNIIISKSLKIINK